MAACMTVLIAGCSATDGPTARFDDYLTRLARTLGQDLTPPAPEPRRHYPARRLLLRTVETPRTGWIGFFKLHRCGLVNLVSERNSILGRVAPPQARLAYEARLLAGLTRCRDGFDRDALATADDDDRDFVSHLDELIALKHQARGAMLWNQTFASAPMAHLFSVAGGDAGLAPSLAGRAPRAALAQLTSAARRLRADKPVNETALAEAYETLDASEYGGGLQISAIEATAALERASQLIRTRLAARPLCFNNKPNRRARVLRTILLEIYGTGVQSYLADLVRAGRLWRAAVDELIAVQGVTPDSAFMRYRDHTLRANGGVWADLDAAIEQHTQDWQHAMRQCDLMPGSSVD
tara:strand:+ start:2195 stop:3250 length:1056 start_codon:yes stop_codon:yes gene_type:complete